MAAPTEYYIDPAIAADSGTGAIGDPYGDVQFALNSVTRDATNGDRFNIKAGTDEILAAALTLATYGTPTGTAPLIFQGYTSAAGDVGQGGISGNGSLAVYSAAGLDITWKDLHLHNCGAATILTLGSFCQVIGCELDNTSGSGIVASAADILDVIACDFQNIGGVGVNALGANVSHCYFKNGTNDFTTAITITGGNRSKYIGFNIFSLDGTSAGISSTGRATGTGYNVTIEHNSVYTTGSGTGINHTTDLGALDVLILNNLVEGWTTGIELGAATTRTKFTALGNAGFNNTADFDYGDTISDSSNESLGATPFAKSGSDTYALRATYFQPVNTGNVYSPFGGMAKAKGAIQAVPNSGGLVVARRAVHHMHW